MRGYDHRFAGDSYAQRAARKHNVLLGYMIFIGIVVALLLLF